MSGTFEQYMASLTEHQPLAVTRAVERLREQWLLYLSRNQTGQLSISDTDSKQLQVLLKHVNRHSWLHNVPCSRSEYCVCDPK